MASLTKKTFVLGYTNPAPFLLVRDGVTKQVSYPFDVSFVNYVVPCFNHDETYLALAYQSPPYIYVYNTSTWAKNSNPAVLPAGAGNDVKFSHNSAYCAVAHGSTPFVTIYDTSTWAKLTNPATLPAGTGTAVAWNNDGSRLAVAHVTTPFITVYDTSTWTKLTDPATLPNSGNCVDYSPDGTKLAVGMSSTPYVHIYNTSDFSKITNPASLPAGQAYGLAFSTGGTYLAVAHQTTPFLKIYKVSDWSSLTVNTYPAPIIAYSVGLSVKWVNDTSLFLSIVGYPGVLEYSITGTTASIVDHFNFNQTSAGINLGRIAVVKGTGWKVAGSIIESMVADTWTATAYDFKSGVIVGQTEFSGTSFTVYVGNPDPVHIVVLANQGQKWQDSKVVAVNEKVFPTNTIATPYYYKADNAGTTGVTEPTWPTAVNSTVTDGTVTWRLVERLIRSRSQFPLNPVPV